MTANADWIQRTTVAMPNPAYATAVAYDTARSRLVLFGGRLSTISMPRSNETWELSATGWTQRTPTTSPSARSGHDMVYDPVRQRVVLFGGFPDTGVRLGDTWTWDGTTWTQQFPTNSPGARSGHRMAWDAARNVVTLFGGRIDGTSAFYLADTWTWDGTTWTQMTTAVSPSAREGVAIAYDPNFMGGQVIVFGGIGSSGNRSDTHAWNGSSWTQLSVTSAPPGRVFHDMTYSPALGKIILFGGSTGGSASATYFNDTWVFDRTTWTQLSPANPPTMRNGHAMDFDPVRNKVQSVGGWDGVQVFATPMEY